MEPHLRNHLPWSKSRLFSLYSYLQEQQYFPLTETDQNRLNRATPPSADESANLEKYQRDELPRRVKQRLLDDLKQNDEHLAFREGLASKLGDIVREEMIRTSHDFNKQKRLTAVLSSPSEERHDNQLPERPPSRAEALATATSTLPAMYSQPPPQPGYLPTFRYRHPPVSAVPAQILESSSPSFMSLSSTQDSQSRIFSESSGSARMAAPSSMTAYSRGPTGERYRPESQVFPNIGDSSVNLPFQVTGTQDNQIHLQNYMPSFIQQTDQENSILSYGMQGPDAFCDNQRFATVFSSQGISPGAVSALHTPSAELFIQNPNSFESQWNQGTIEPARLHDHGFAQVLGDGRDGNPELDAELQRPPKRKFQ
jgi:hypothetical protein